MLTITNGEGTITLRPWRTTDIDDLVKYADNPKIAANMADMFPNPYTRKDAENFIHRIKDDDPAKIMAIVVNGIAVGSIGVFQQQDINRLNAELGYWLAEDLWGKGIMTLAVKEMIRYGFERFPVRRIFARPYPDNPASKKVMEKAGMKLEAIIKNSLIKNGVIFDELIYAIRKQDLL